MTKLHSKRSGPWVRKHFWAPAHFILELRRWSELVDASISQVVMGSLARAGLSVPESLAAIESERIGNPMWKLSDTAPAQFSVTIPGSLDALIRARAKDTRQSVRRIVMDALERSGGFKRRASADAMTIAAASGNGSVIARRWRYIELEADECAGELLRRAATRRGLTVQGLFADALTEAKVIRTGLWADAVDGRFVKVSSHRGRQRKVRLGLLMPELVWNSIVEAAGYWSKTNLDLLIQALLEFGVRDAKLLADAKLRLFDVVGEGAERRFVPSRGRRYIGHEQPKLRRPKLNIADREAVKQ